MSKITEALRAIVDFCDDPNGSENPESLAMGLARLLPAAREALSDKEWQTPEGWKLVPVEPSPKMHRAAWDACDNGMKQGKDWAEFNARLWTAMLSTTPKATGEDK